jgi:hypothetical protein
VSKTLLNSDPFFRLVSVVVYLLSFKVR